MHWGIDCRFGRYSELQRKLSSSITLVLHVASRSAMMIELAAGQLSERYPAVFG